ncbi:transcription termination factor 2 isoform X1 [Agrilus planipennis]|uniref:Transcription termination factor 2 n=1 Tax=Agrilus planipennis TaxID=224129 RepID=A0A1W4WPH2_AGRPL|nr:transcription termination factor 2 isoform X1 [Agrilus planipennis]
MSVNNDKSTNPLAWEDLQLGSVAVQPKTFGRQALETYNSQKALTMDRLQQLHGSLNTAPDENIFAEPPKKLKVELMPHQRRALAWLIWREKQKPSGGILADDMGLGKTLTMISLILKDKQEQEEENQNHGNNSEDEENSERRGYKYKGGTLVVCPASLVQQWEGEVAKHVKKNILGIELYYGTNREQRAKRLARQDMVITTYGLVKTDSDKNGPLFNVRWKRIILDEAHQIRNHKTQSSVAVCNLSAKSRWALTGTPVHNKELDLYSLLKFLRCSPFDDLGVWKRWIDRKDSGGQLRLNTVIASLLLRRTKEQLYQKGALDCLPKKQWDLITVNFDKEELNVYQKILLFSKALFHQFLCQKAYKNADRAMEAYGPSTDNSNKENMYMKMHKMLKVHMNVKEVKQTDILVLLLRLRQICCHPSLIKGMLSEDECDGLSGDESLEELNILDKLQNLNLNEELDNQEEQQNVAEGLSTNQEEVPLAEAAKSILSSSNPVFSKDRKSSKINAILNRLKDIMSTGDKAVVVSQWPTLLQLFGIHLKEYGIVFDQFDGSLPMLKRQEVVTKFNDPYSKTRVLLLSLTAGGVGLNLVGANHLLLTDLHWNPQLEQQAQDRIYRVGQKKSVNIYKFMVVDSIEERIKGLQDKKMDMAENVLTGAKTNQNKLSLNDLRMLFEM